MEHVDELTLGEVTLTKYGMLYLEEYDTAVIADLHIGYEDVMASKGIFLPRIQHRILMDLLERIYNVYAPGTLVVNGDFKHEFSKNMHQEWNEIESVLDFITSHGKVVVVRGNHDNFLGAILKKRGITMVNSYRVGKYLLAHGHRYVKSDSTLIIGHEHPSVTLRDEISASVKVPCYLYSSELIVLPAMSIYASGTDITKNDFISPVLREHRGVFEIFGIDEKMGVIPLGQLSSRRLLSEAHQPHG